MLRRLGCLGILASLLAYAGCRRAETGGVDVRKEAAAEIHRAVGNVRPIEPRLSLDTGWAPCCTRPSTLGARGFRKLSDLVRQRDGRVPLAILPLFLATDRDATRAVIGDLEPAVQPEDLSDLSAAYLHLAGLANRPDLLLASLEASSEALALRPRDPAAGFNRALVLSRLHLSSTALAAWQEYLDTTPAVGWSAEARDREKALQTPSYPQRWRSEIEPALSRAARGNDLPRLRAIVVRHRQRSREWAENERLAAWASGQGSSATAALQDAGRVGTILAGLSGDRMLDDGVKAIAAAGQGGESAVRLRTGHRELAAGLDALYKRWRLAEARDHFQRARMDLRGSPFALWAELYLGLITYYQGDFRQAAAALATLRSHLDSARYPVLAGRVHWIEGLIAAASTYRLTDADAHYQKAIRVFQGLGEDENLAAVQALRSEVLNKLGDSDESWAALAAALARVDRIFDPIRHHAVLEVAILNAQRERLHHAGLAFADEHLVVARRTGSPQILHYSFLHRAGFRYALGDLAGAQADLAAASRAAEGLQDPSLRQRSAADLELVSAEILAATEPARAVSLLGRTIEQYERTQYAYLLPQAYGARARAFRRLGNLAAAEQDLARQIGIYEGSVDETRQDIFRLTLLDQAAPAFDEMIGLQAMALGRPAAALEYCERSRLRSFRDVWVKAPPGLASLPPSTVWARFDIPSLRFRLPQDVAILEYALLEDHLLAWVITRSGVRSFSSAIPRKGVARQVRELVRRLGQERKPAAAQILYDLLVRPAAPYLQGISHLVIVPDKELFLVPFDALVDRQTGRFLAEDQGISIAPSASLYLQLLQRTRPRSPGEALDRAVAVTGAPGGGYRYRRLPDAPEEARAVAALYLHGSLLENPDEKAFLDALGANQVVHFAGHAIPGGDQPFASRLVLADTPARQVELHARELYDRAFPQLELVVLSACETAEASRPQLGLAATLAGPFLAAGVPQIIGSQWPVKDRATRSFFAAFHRHFAQGADAATALRATKLELLHSPDPVLASPRTWAAFVLIGG